MPVTIDSQGEPQGPRLGRKLLILLAVIVGLLFAARSALSYWVDLLWFRSLDYGDIFWTAFRLQWGPQWKLVAPRSKRAMPRARVRSAYGVQLSWLVLFASPWQAEAIR